jgi:hypothetical protein
MLTRLHISSFLGLTVVAWLLALWAQGAPLIGWEFLRPFGIVVGTITFVAVIFARWAWAWRVFQGWYVKRPDIRGTWKVILHSDWIDPATGRNIEPIVAFAAIRQSLTTLSLRLMTPESKSKLVAHSIEEDVDGIYRLAGVYRNEPSIGLQGRRSDIHHGALSLEIHGSPPECLEGHYWTDRKTRGELKATDRRDKVYDSYDAAKAAFG